MRKSRLIFLIVVILAGLILARLACRPDLAAWPRCDYFRCRTCGGSASIDPDQPECWGCRVCGFTTFRPFDRFATATRADFPTDRAHRDAMRRAGVVADVEGVTLIRIYQDSRGWR